MRAVKPGVPLARPAPRPAPGPTRPQSHGRPPDGRRPGTPRDGRRLHARDEAGYERVEVAVRRDRPSGSGRDHRATAGRA